MLTKVQRNGIRSLLQDGRFQAIEDMKKEIIQHYHEINTKADTEFQTLWNVATKEAKIEGLNDFFLKLIDEAGKD